MDILQMSMKKQTFKYFTSETYLFAWFAINTVALRSFSFCFEMMDNPEVSYYLDLFNFNSYSSVFLYS